MQYKQNSQLVGIDEAGRGALAGPMMMAACCLKNTIDGLCDSKKLTERKREELYMQILNNSQYCILAFSVTQIDTLGLSSCLRLGLEVIRRHFLQKIDDRFFNKNIHFLYDGNTNFGVSGISTLVKADVSVPAVSAASILAKVTRDRVMKFLADEFKEYEFEKHKAYGTKRHKELLKQFGICALHRKSFKLF
ncbi:ribonuclease HII [Campylobacter sp. MIT 21-1685]|uniref:ribonuclease HII n=1 Tax=unclassified Campylobacter TaxID=2593542 RepID=UPI00224B971D|nr:MULTISPECIES: ribonuclease HII [unclassified Campylobacter]MCX2683631.1 ribonuclease HII [Campylobacter sp. MIT 21-1684]MCX2751914.1 ribonuclease HII [Campylobacter sp. MIT 21-1682]MCX2808115.1 ribonuclease HII [Campylobacter sp. MIT 21-1685]